MKQPFRTFGVSLVAMILAVLAGCPSNNRDPVAGQTRTFDGIEFQWCPAGSLMMGSPSDEVGRQMDETVRAVTISQGFWLGKYEVTQAQWEKTRGTNPSYHIGDDLPVEMVNWDDAQDFLDVLNAGASGASYRLATEAEWEYAHRAGTTTRFYWGDDPNLTAVDKRSWHNGNSDATHAVGLRIPNNWGLCDMSGNAAEWCQDRYGDYVPGPVTDPQGPSSGTSRVVRGGSWLDDPELGRSAARNYAAQDVLSRDIGFRVLRTKE